VYGHVPAVGIAVLAVAVSAVALRPAPRPEPSSTRAASDGSRAHLEQSPDEGPAPDSGPGTHVAAARELRQDLDMLFESADEDVQREIIRAIVDVGTSEGAELLDRALAEGTPAIRLEASHAMCSLGWPDRVARLRDAMDASGGALREQFAVALVCLGDREGIAVLEHMLHAEGLLRVRAAEALAMAGKRELAVPVLERELAGAVPGSAPWLRAAHGLLILGHADARGRLRSELARPEPERAVAAADLLAEIGDREALAYLDRVLADAAFTGRAEAASSLARHARDDAAVAGRVIAFAQAALASQDARDRRAAAAVMGRLAEYGGGRFAPALEALINAIDTDDARNPEERAVRSTARVALLAVYRAMESRNPP
jgi:HEAT repeat protein